MGSVGEETIGKMFFLKDLFVREQANEFNNALLNKVNAGRFQRL